MTLSPDGKHVFADGEWRPVPRPPRSGLDRAHEWFRVVLSCLLALLVVGVVVSLVMQ